MRTWLDVARVVAAQADGSRWEVPKADVPTDPRTEGFREAQGWPCGQRADYRLTLTDGRSVHVQDMGTVWHVHTDAVDPDVDAAGHLAADLPGLTLVLAPVVGAGLAQLVFRRPGAWKTGALAGTAMAAAAINRRRR